MRVEHILTKKGGHYVSIEPDRSLTEAIGLMMEHRFGSLLVMEGGRLESIVTERDVMRAVHQYGDGLKDIKVRDVMAPRLITCHHDCTVDKAMDLMLHNETGNRVRHLPVMDGTELKGLISIADIIEALLTETLFENKLLKNYIKNWPEEDEETLA